MAGGVQNADFRGTTPPITSYLKVVKFKAIIIHSVFVPIWKFELLIAWERQTDWFFNKVEPITEGRVRKNENRVCTFEATT